LNDHINYFWFRRDLRLEDNVGLYHALNSGVPLRALFIFDKDILDKLDDKHDARLVFIHRQLKKIDLQMREYGSTLLVEYGKPLDVWKKLIKKNSIGKVFSNRDYEPYAIRRDSEIERFLSLGGVEFNQFKDQVIFDRDDVCKDDGSPYTVFTPYSKKWKSILKKNSFTAVPSESLLQNFMPDISGKIFPLSSIGFDDFLVDFPPSILNKKVIQGYEKTRDIPSQDGTSRLSIHLRFGTISIRELFRKASSVSQKWIEELIWREFYMSILWHFPHVENNAFKPVYDRLNWLQDEKGFELWCEGRTGYPIVDAGMRELNQTGFMHNRLRMITATFLTKYLLIDWRWGEAYFARKLLDFDLAANNGGWQWCAGTGVDAAPYFRIFSMDSQTSRFDPDHIYIKKWVPEFNTPKYPKPIVDYKFARQRCLDFYKNGLGKS